MLGWESGIWISSSQEVCLGLLSDIKKILISLAPRNSQNVFVSGSFPGFLDLATGGLDERQNSKIFVRSLYWEGANSPKVFLWKFIVWKDALQATVTYPLQRLLGRWFSFGRWCGICLVSRRVGQFPKSIKKSQVFFSMESIVFAIDLVFMEVTD